jgi:hypothetical protein
MGDVVGLFRTRVTINGDDYELSPKENLLELKRRMESAAEAPGHFVDFLVAGGNEVSVLITPMTRVALYTTKVTRDIVPVGEITPQFPDEFDY